MLLVQLKKLYSHSGFIKYFKNTNWLFLEQFLKMFASLAVGIYVARYLGPEKLGLLNYTIVLTSFTLPFWRLGLNPIVYKEFIKKEEKEESLFGTSIYTQIGMYFIVGLIFTFLVFASRLEPNEKIILCIIFLGNFFLVSDIFEQYFNAKVMSKYVSYASITTTFIITLARIALVLLAMDLIYFAIAIVLDLMVKAFLLGYYGGIKSNITLKFWRFDKTLLKKLLQESWPFILTGTMTGIYMKIDQVMIKHMIDNEATGIYAVAIKLSQVWFVIPLVLTRSLFPAIINAKQKSEKLFQDRIQKLYLLMVGMSLVIAAIMYLSSDLLVTLLFGEQFIGSIIVLKWYIWSVPFVFLGLVTESWMLAKGLQKLLVYNKAIAVLINVALNYILLEQIGVVGAAIATVVSYGSIIFAPLIWKKSRINISVLLNSYKVLYPNKRM